MSCQVIIRRACQNRAMKAHPPIHPGEILLQEFLEPMEISQYRLAKDISVPPRRINEIVHGKRAISADTALRLARYFGTTERFWLNLQTRYVFEVEKARLKGVLSRKWWYPRPGRRLTETPADRRCRGICAPSE